MPLSRFTTYAAYALDLNNGQLSANIGQGATTLPLTNVNGYTALSTAGASYSAIIIDGPLTETVVLSTPLSGGAGTATCTCAATANAHNEWVYVVFQLTASVGPTAYIPLETYKPSDTYDQLYDMAAVGSLVDNRGAVQGVRTSSWDLGGAFFADTFPYFLGAVEGAVDYSTIAATTVAVGDNGTALNALAGTLDVAATTGYASGFVSVALASNGKTAILSYTGTGVGTLTGVKVVSGTGSWTLTTADVVTAVPVSTHAFSVQNNPSQAVNAYGVMPPRVLLYNFDGYNTRIFCGRITEVGITIDPKQLLKFTAKFLGRASGVVTNPTKSFSAVVTLPAWTGVATIGGVNVGKILSGDITWARGEVEAIPTQSGTQDPWDIYLGALSTKGKMALVFDDDVQQANYYNASQPAVVLTFTRAQVTSGQQAIFTIQMTDCNYEKADITQQGKAYVTNDITFAGIGNATDATTAGTGISTSKVTVQNNVVGANVYI